MKKIELVARELEIAPIRIHQLIRNKQISYKADKLGVYVDEREINRWFDQHPDQLQRWKEAYDYTKKHLISNGYVQAYRD